MLALFEYTVLFFMGSKILAHVEILCAQRNNLLHIPLHAYKGFNLSVPTPTYTGDNSAMTKFCSLLDHLDNLSPLH